MIEAGSSAAPTTTGAGIPWLAILSAIGGVASSLQQRRRMKRALAAQKRIHQIEIGELEREKGNVVRETAEDLAQRGMGGTPHARAKMQQIEQATADQLEKIRQQRKIERQQLPTWFESLWGGGAPAVLSTVK